MRGLTLHQPWASFVAVGAKSIETRAWATRYRGELAIHAGANERAFDDAMRLPSMRQIADEFFIDDFPLGAIVASCRLIDVVAIDDALVKTLGWHERALGFYAPGRYAWMLDDVKPLSKPIKIKGAMGVWTMTGIVAQLVHNDSKKVDTVISNNFA